MLKIKDGVDSKELEKFGFLKKHWGYIFYPKKNGSNCKYFSAIKIEQKSKIISFDLENMSSWCNSLEELDDDFENIQYSYNEFKNVINDLKQANLIEETGEQC